MIGRNGQYPWEDSRFVGVPRNAADATPFVPSQMQLQTLEAATQQSALKSGKNFFFGSDNTMQSYNRLTFSYLSFPLTHPKQTSCPRTTPTR